MRGPPELRTDTWSKESGDRVFRAQAPLIYAAMYRVYLIADGPHAACINPPHDTDRVRQGGRNGETIELTFETHRNKDYISGAKDLDARCATETGRGIAGKQQ